jgi:hypothetical protein
MTHSHLRWYRGDLHTHTNCSDGLVSPVQLVESAIATGLEFLAITDHNTIEAFSQVDGNLGITILPGIELTLPDGDMNVLGVDQWFDWMDQICVMTSRLNQLEGKYQTTTDLARRTSSLELLNSLNHPLREPWHWRGGSMDLRYLHCIEIWNDPSWHKNAQDNPRAVSLWTDLLNAGYRIAGIGGSDFHRPSPPPGKIKPAERVGTPSTYVRARELSSAAILDALRERRAFVSIGPRVIFHAHVSGLRYDIGDVIGESADTLEFSASIFSAPDHACAQIVKDGEVVLEQGLDGNPAMLQYLANVDPAEASWFRLDVRDRDGAFLAITNPIFIGRPRPPFKKTFGDFVHT